MVVIALVQARTNPLVRAEADQARALLVHTARPDTAGHAEQESVVVVELDVLLKVVGVAHIVQAILSIHTWREITQVNEWTIEEATANTARFGRFVHGRVKVD